MWFLAQLLEVGRGDLPAVCLSHRLEGCLLTSDCCQAVNSLLLGHRNLRYLDLSRNYIGLSGLQLFCETFQEWTLNTKVVL